MLLYTYVEKCQRMAIEIAHAIAFHFKWVGFIVYLPKSTYVDVELLLKLHLFAVVYVFFFGGFSFLFYSFHHQE